MHPIWKLSTPLILLTATACAHNPPNVSLGLGPIICPASLQTHEPGPGPIDRAILETLPPAAVTYFMDYGVQVESSLDAANAKGDEALEACADYNRRLAQAAP